MDLTIGGGREFLNKSGCWWSSFCDNRFSRWSGGHHGGIKLLTRGEHGIINVIWGGEKKMRKATKRGSQQNLHCRSIVPSLLKIPESWRICSSESLILRWPTWSSVRVVIVFYLTSFSFFIKRLGMVIWVWIYWCRAFIALDTGVVSEHTMLI